ncbi:hypothetical protein [uncultured Shewanella sp.]|uniref:hypothetical protein n=1 Tax=Shewanella atlantica TaxID=271099 RepID=UPI00261303CB|nr:hypothetical protein [uncultured Shewanella sp.]
MKLLLSLCIALISAILLSGLLTACSSGAGDLGSGSEATLSGSPHNNLKQISTCGSMPPIKDRTKLKQSLLERGLLKEEMSLDETNRIVAEYINKRQQAFGSCPKIRL